MRIPTIVAALALAAAVPAAAQAMPIAQPIPLAGNDAPAVELTAGGCGIGFHRTFYGGCRPFGGYGYGYRRFGYGYGFRGGYGYRRGYFHRF